MPWDDPNDTYRKGGWWVIDYFTGFKVRNWDTKKQWNGVVTADPDKRNPQETLRGVKARRTTPNPSPEPPTDTFLETNEISRDAL